MSMPFPTEILMLIIFFIPRGREIRRLMGVNPLFFEAAMDDIYGSQTFTPNVYTSTDLFTMSLFRLTRTQQPEVGARVHHLFVDPPTMAREEMLSAPVPSPMFISKILFRPRPVQPQSRRECIMQALHLAIRPLDMWTAVNSSLRELQIHSTWDRIATLLDGSQVANLESVVITITHGYSGLLDRLSRKAPFVDFLQSQRHSLRSLLVSNMEHTDMAYLAGVGHFPRLEQLRIQAVMNHITFSSHISSILTRFLDAHKFTLQILTILPNNLEDSVAYSAWTAEAFPTLEFPALRTLEMGTLGSLFPYIPQLTSLTLTISQPTDVSSVIEKLHQSSGNHTTKQIHSLPKNKYKIELEAVNGLVAATKSEPEIAFLKLGV